MYKRQILILSVCIPPAVAAGILSVLKQQHGIQMCIRDRAFRYQNGNSPQASDCVAIVMFSIVFLVYAIANLSGKADLAKSMAG